MIEGLLYLLVCVITRSQELTRADRRIVSLPLAVLETLPFNEPVFRTAESNYVSVVAVICYLGQILVHFNVTFKRQHGQRAAATKRAA